MRREDDAVKGTAAARKSPSRQRAGDGAAENFLQQARRLKEQLAAFDRSARIILRRLNPRIPEPEIEAMKTPAANLTGILECLLADDFKPARRKLLELDRLLRKADLAA
jgi:hypothetical protein